MAGRFLPRIESGRSRQIGVNNERPELGGGHKVQGSGVGNEKPKVIFIEPRQNALGEEDGQYPFFNIRYEWTTFVYTGMEAERSIHHEPPKHELKAAGKEKDASSAAICTDLAGHALLHMVRFDLFHNQHDENAYTSIIRRMPEDQREKYDRLSKDKNVVTGIRKLIMDRQIRFDLE